MGSPIGTIPQGLLSLLALKQTGQNPNDLLNTLQPSIDLTSFLLQRLVVDTPGFFNGTTPLTANLTSGQHGNNAFVPNAQVPQNECWWIEWCGIVISGNTVAAADTVSGGLGIISTLGTTVMVTPVTADVVTARARTWITNPNPRPFFVGPGSVFTFVTDDILSVGGMQFFLQLRGARLLI